MVDFNASLRRGLDAAKQAQNNRDEIRDVFGELNQALRAVSSGKVEVAIVPLGATMDGLSRLVLTFDRGNEEEVIAVRPIAHSELPARRIARWKQGDAGYPCSIIWGERHASCDDAESLRNELAALVSSPPVGEAIFQVMQLPTSDPTV